MDTKTLLEIIETRRCSCGNNATEIEFLNGLAEKLNLLEEYEDKQQKIREASKAFCELL